ncbi:MAG TPA: hypothetical protein VNK95_23220 [Caldilineaceae bacterium]|nr:hypothetical protein [Caldilineaceae bacterium]
MADTTRDNVRADTTRTDTVRTETVTTARTDGSNVEVYDTGSPTASRDARPPMTGPVGSDLPSARTGTNWGAILLVLLIVLALIFLAMWLF